MKYFDTRSYQLWIIKSCQDYATETIIENPVTSSYNNL